MYGRTPVTRARVFITNESTAVSTICSSPQAVPKPWGLSVSDFRQKCSSLGWHFSLQGHEKLGEGWSGGDSKTTARCLPVTSPGGTFGQAQSTGIPTPAVREPPGPGAWNLSQASSPHARLCYAPCVTRWRHTSGHVPRGLWEPAQRSPSQISGSSRGLVSPFAAGWERLRWRWRLKPRGQRGPRGDAAVVAGRQCELVASACRPAHLPVLEVHRERSSLIGTCTSRRAGQGEDSPQGSEYQAAAMASLAKGSPVD